MALAVLGLIFFIILNVYFQLILLDLNPFSNNPHTGSQSMTQIYSQVIFLLLPIYFLTSQQIQQANLFLFIYGFAAFLVTYFRVKNGQYHNPDIQRLQVYLDAILFWIILCSFLFSIQSITSNDGQIIVMIIIGIPLVVLVTEKLLDFRFWNIITRDKKKCKNDVMFE